MLDNRILFGLLILGVVMLYIIGAFSPDEDELNFVEVMKSSNIKKVETYLKNYKERKRDRYNEAKQRLIYLRFKQAQKIDETKVYERFLKDFKEENIKRKYITQVKFKIMEKKYAIVRKKNSIEALEKFQKKYPLSFKIRVKTDLENLYYKKSCKSNSIEDYKLYLKKFPRGRYVKKVKEKIMEVRFKMANCPEDIESLRKIFKKFKKSKYGKIIKEEIYNIYKKDFEKRDQRGTRESYMKHLEKFNYETPFKKLCLKNINDIDNREPTFRRIGKLSLQYIFKAELDGITFDAKELPIIDLAKDKVNNIIKYTYSDIHDESRRNNNLKLKIKCYIEPLRIKYMDEHNESTPFIYNGVIISGKISIIQLNKTKIVEKFYAKIPPPLKYKNGFFTDGNGIKRECNKYLDKKNVPYKEALFMKNSYMNAIIKVLYKVYGDNFIISLMDNKNLQIKNFAKNEFIRKHPEIKKNTPVSLRVWKYNNEKYIKDILLNLTSISNKIRLKNIKLLASANSIYSIPTFITYLDDMNNKISDICYKSLKKITKNKIISKNKDKWQKWWKKRKFMLKPVNHSFLFYWFNDKRMTIINN